LQALLKGMHDVDIRTRVLSRTQNNELEKLSDVIDYIAAEEASSASFSTLTSPHTIAGSKSSYKSSSSTLDPHQISQSQTSADTVAVATLGTTARPVDSSIVRPLARNAQNVRKVTILPQSVAPQPNQLLQPPLLLSNLRLTT
jgi:hypothetical protein